MLRAMYRSGLDLLPSKYLLVEHIARILLSDHVDLCGRRGSRGALEKHVFSGARWILIVQHSSLTSVEFENDQS